MKNWMRFFVLAVSLIAVSCGGGGGSASSVTTALVPANLAANVEIDAAVTVQFSGAVTAPASWAGAFTLRKDDAGDSLCTDVTYADLVATCAHASLDRGASYTIRLAGMRDDGGLEIADAAATFTTVGLTPVGGSVVLRGTLSVAAGSLAAPKALSKATDVAGYRALVLNAATGEQESSSVAAGGSFSMTITGGSSYMINFLDSGNKFIGTLKAGTAGGSKVSMGIVTGGDGTTTDLGAVAANSDTGLVTSDQALTTDANLLAYAVDGVIAGGNSGVGSTDYSSAVGSSCTAAAADCPDLDHDGVPDIFDTDNDNNTYADEIDGSVDLCVPASVSLYVRNYPTSGAVQPGFPTPAEVSADLGATTMYQISLLSGLICEAV